MLSYAHFQWGFVVVFFLIDFFWITFSSLSFHFDLKIIVFQVLAAAVLYLAYKFYEKFRPNPRIILLLQQSFFFFTFCPLVLVFSYLTNTTTEPFVDSTLASIDRFFGIYTPTFFYWTKAHKTWHLIFQLLYDSYFYQFLLVLFYFGYRWEEGVLPRFVMQFMIAVSITSAICYFYPAEGPYVWYNYIGDTSIFIKNAFYHLQELRHNIVDIIKKDGIITFPSFHAVMGMVFVYTFRNQKKVIFIPILILNILMILVCMPIGGHYFADLLAAVPVFLITIGLEALIYKCVTRSWLKNMKKTEKLNPLTT